MWLIIDEEHNSVNPIGKVIKGEQFYKKGESLTGKYFSSENFTKIIKLNRVAEILFGE